jgi:hypothetical protein
LRRRGGSGTGRSEREGGGLTRLTAADQSVLMSAQRNLRLHSRKVYLGRARRRPIGLNIKGHFFWASSPASRSQETEAQKKSPAVGSLNSAAKPLPSAILETVSHPFPELLVHKPKRYTDLPPFSSLITADCHTARCPCSRKKKDRITLRPEQHPHRPTPASMAR